MYRIGSVILGFDYPDRILSKNRSLTCFVVSKHDDKVQHVAVVERASLEYWYTSKKKQYSEDFHYFLVSTTSIVGEIIDIVTEEELKNMKNQPSKEPLTN